MIVIDASVAVKWVIPEDGSSAARNLQSEELAAPDLWLVEATNALWRRANGGTLSLIDAQFCLTELMNAPVARLATEPYLLAAIDLSVQLRHSIYDCIYLAAAIRAGTHVVTADTRFLAAVTRRSELKQHVRLLGEG